MGRRLATSLVLLLVAAAPAAGSGIDGRKQSIDARIASLHEKIARAEQQEHTLSTQIEAVTTQIRTLEGRVGDVSARLGTLERDLTLHQRRLSRLTELYRLETRRFRFFRREYDAALERLNRRLVEIYESGEPSTIEVVLSATSFSDLLAQVDYVNAIGVQDRRVAAEVHAAKEQVRRARERTKRTRAVVGSETRAIAVRTAQVRSVRDQLLASEHRLSSARGRESQALATVRESKRAYVGEADALAQVSAQLAARIQAAQASSPYTPSTDTTPSSSGLIWPVSGPVVSPFGMRWGRLHTGIDIAVPAGTPIRAAAAGNVIYAGWMGGYGNLTIIDHGRGLATAYAHQSSIGVTNGQRVAQGQTIGNVGCTGHCFGPHLHFEVRVNGTPVDPLGYL